MREEGTKPLDDTGYAAAALLLDEWKFRQQHAWKSLQRFGYAAVFVSVIPYVKIGLFANLGMWALIFPLVGWLLGVASAWLFGAEYVRFHQIHKAYQKPLVGIHPGKEMKIEWETLFGMQIGKVAIIVTVLGFTVLSLLNVVLIHQALGL